ncbi:MAG: NADH:flavin oxidoreductase/NADH oxidase family protein [Desulfobacterales bacterium]|nr:NADH:flavin oxidoreductase/NADH oxidase family protein [Desulfobacterales bacterium]
MSLSQSITLPNNTRIKNRLFKSAMSEQLGDKAHNPTDRLATLYRTWAAGGIGVSVTGNVMVDRNALGEPRNVVLDGQSDLDAFKTWAEAGKENNTQLWMQLNHPGKQSPKFLDTEPVAPSAVPLEGGLSKAFGMPRELTEPEILNIIQSFALSSRLAKETGFTGVQIHGAHGYLVNQFLSPHHNRRSDDWGGSLENRMRFVTEIYKAIRNEVGKDFPVGIKLNASDFREGGFTIEEAIQVAVTLETLGIDCVEISGGSYEHPKMMGSPSGSPAKNGNEGYFTGFAAAMKKSLTVPLVLTGGFRSGSAMEAVLQSGAADIIGLARPLAMAPDFPNRLLADTAHGISLPRVSTGIRSLDAITSLGLTWYEYHLYTMGKGREVNPEASAWLSVFLTFWRLGAHGFAQRRAKK